MDTAQGSSQPGYVIVDAVTACQTWNELEGYEDAFVIAVGPNAPLNAISPSEQLTEEDIKLLLERASVFLADNDRYRSLAEEVGVRFFKVE